jgi:hypothetical protein
MSNPINPDHADSKDFKNPEETIRYVPIPEYTAFDNKNEEPGAVRVHKAFSPSHGGETRLQGIQRRANEINSQLSSTDTPTAPTTTPVIPSRGSRLYICIIVILVVGMTWMAADRYLPRVTNESLIDRLIKRDEFLFSLTENILEHNRNIETEKKYTYSSKSNECQRVRENTIAMCRDSEKKKKEEETKRVHDMRDRTLKTLTDTGIDKHLLAKFHILTFEYFSNMSFVIVSPDICKNPEETYYYCNKGVDLEVEKVEKRMFTKNVDEYINQWKNGDRSVDLETLFVKTERQLADLFPEEAREAKDRMKRMEETQWRKDFMLFTKRGFQTLTICFICGFMTFAILCYTK